VITSLTTNAPSAAVVAVKISPVAACAWTVAPAIGAPAAVVVRPLIDSPVAGVAVIVATPDAASNRHAIPTARKRCSNDMVGFL
jgi:hypothetical protein